MLGMNILQVSVWILGLMDAVKMLTVELWMRYHYSPASVMPFAICLVTVVMILPRSHVFRLKVCTSTFSTEVFIAR